MITILIESMMKSKKWGNWYEKGHIELMQIFLDAKENRQFEIIFQIFRYS